MRDGGQPSVQTKVAEPWEVRLQSSGLMGQVGKARGKLRGQCPQATPRDSPVGISEGQGADTPQRLAPSAKQLPPSWAAPLPLCGGSQDLAPLCTPWSLSSRQRLNRTQAASPSKSDLRAAPPRSGLSGPGSPLLLL